MPAPFSLCPRCRAPFDASRGALSRVDNETKICSSCGSNEAVAMSFGVPLKPLNEPQNYWIEVK